MNKSNNENTKNPYIDQQKSDLEKIAFVSDNSIKFYTESE